MALAFELTRDPTASDSSIVSDGVFSFGRKLAADGNASPLACFVRAEGMLVAGAVGRTEYERLFISSLWVTEERRCQGLGREVLERLEREAVHLGCNSAMIETLNDRVAGLYSRHGYRTLAVVYEYVGPFNRHIMLKALHSATPRSAA
jgi:GNAT superfamily N-acetyltransferase